MEDKKIEFVNRFSWVGWDLSHLVQKYGFPEAVDVLIQLLWEQYYMKKPLYDRDDIVAIIGELEGFKLKLKRGE